MSQVNYAAMSDQELRQHFLRHREDKAALRAYLDRLRDRPRNIITTVDDPDFDSKIYAAVLQQMQAADDNGEAEA
jgi:flagellar biosynthesis regulator FlaF